MADPSPRPTSPGGPATANPLAATPVPVSTSTTSPGATSASASASASASVAATAAAAAGAVSGAPRADAQAGSEEWLQMLAGRAAWPERAGNWLAQLYFHWVHPLMMKGNKQPLELTDLWKVDRPEEAEYLYTAWQAAWATRRSSWGCLKAVFGWEYFIAGCFKLCNSLTQLLPSIILLFLLRYYEVYGTPSQQAFGLGLFLTFALGLVQILRSALENRYFHLTVRTGLRARAAVGAAVYNKSLRLSPSARQGSTLGQMVNLMQLDAARVDNAAQVGHTMWDSALQITAYIIQLLFYIGPSALAGLATMLLLIPIQGILMMKLSKLRSRIVGHTDHRIKLENEVLQSIRAIKMYNWEERFLQNILGVRDKELQILRGSATLRAINSVFMMAAPAVVAIVTLYVYVGAQGTFLPSVIFAALSVFQQLRFPLMMYPMAISAMSDLKVSLRRLDKFLSAEEVSGDYLLPASASVPTAPGSVTVVDGEFYWATEEEAPTPATGDKAGKGGKPAKGGKPGKAADNGKGAGDGVKSEKTNDSVSAAAGASTPTADTQTPPAEGKAEEGAAGPAVPVAPQPALSNFNVQINPGELVAVVGPVGSGKSTFCRALLGELKAARACVSVAGSIAYVAQTAWILNCSLRDNVLFGKTFDEERYRTVRHACQLNPDIRVLPDGDRTMIGERGINLSGGQKQRVAIARALYQSADVYMFDDPLSALDAQVGKALFEQAIVAQLAGKTRIFVTNQLQYLRFCDRIIVLEPAGRGGRIAEVGTFSELMAKGAAFSQLMNEFGHGAHHEEETTVEEVDGDPTADATPGGRHKSVSVTRGHRGSTVGGQSEPAKQLIEAEERSKGAVPVRVYWNYFKAGSLWLFWLTFLAFTICEVSNNFQGAVVALWTADPYYQKASVGVYMALYGGNVAVLCVLTFIRTFALSVLAVRSSDTLHHNLLRRILRAPIAFFDTTPIGRIIARFSKDMDMIDNQLPFVLSMAFLMFFLFGGMTITVFSQTVYFIPIMIPILIIYWYIAKFFRNTSRELKRLDSISRSPVVAQFSETLGGLSTIRAFGHQSRFARMHFALTDVNSSAWYSLKVVDRWLAVRLDALGVLVILAVALLVLQSVTAGNLSPSFAGFALSLGMGLIGVMGWIVRTIADTENGMNSVERVLYYSETTPQEAVEEIPGAVTAEWPSRGCIQFTEVQMRYREDTPLVLKGVNVTINPGEKIGVVGRTGSGKSSVLLTLFRIMELADGTITIDGVDIGKIGLSQLRSKLSIIPQDPMLFAGTIRQNIDPFTQYKDEQVWNALKLVGLADVLRPTNSNPDAGVDAVADMASGLSKEVSEGGENFSVGQKQLLCLARVVLRKNRILVLDEATSSVDVATDAVMQRTLREHFSDCTMITIAHRLNTIMDADKILVMDNGVVAEFASPKELLTNPNSLFSAMCAAERRQHGGDAGGATVSA